MWVFPLNAEENLQVFLKWQCTIIGVQPGNLSGIRNCKWKWLCWPVPLQTVWPIWNTMDCSAGYLTLFKHWVSNIRYFIELMRKLYSVTASSLPSEMACYMPSVFLKFHSLSCENAVDFTGHKGELWVLFVELNYFIQHFSDRRCYICCCQACISYTKSFPWVT